MSLVHCPCRNVTRSAPVMRNRIRPRECSATPDTLLFCPAEIATMIGEGCYRNCAACATHPLQSLEDVAGVLDLQESDGLGKRFRLTCRAVETAEVHPIVCHRCRASGDRKSTRLNSSHQII